MAFIDVQRKLLYYVVAAFSDKHSGAVIDYGAYPDQGRSYFTLSDAKRTLGRAKPGSGIEGSIHAGLETLVGRLMTKAWRREDGDELTIGRLLIDAGWQTDTVDRFCRLCAYPAVMASMGMSIRASSKPFSEYKKHPGDRVGEHWRIPRAYGRGKVRRVQIDTNYWKSFVHARLATAPGDPGCLSLFGKPGTDHRMITDHLLAEYAVRNEALGRCVDEWRIKPGSPDNHLLDGLVGCVVAASTLGASLFEPGAKQARKQRPAQRIVMPRL